MLSESQRAIIRARLDATLTSLEAATTFPWRNPLDAVHEENRFQRDADKLGDEGKGLWSRFDEALDRLYATLAAENAPFPDATH